MSPQPFPILTHSVVKPTKRTFEAPKVRRVVMAHVQDGKGWADPCAGWFTVPEFTNDMNPDRPAKDNMEALEWLRRFESNSLNGVVLDPPFSPTQVKRAYNDIGRAPSKKACDASWWAMLKDEAARIIKPGGIAITCGWNSNGLSERRGFAKLERHSFASGGQHNDLVVCIERKADETLAVWQPGSATERRRD